MYQCTSDAQQYVLEGVNNMLKRSLSVSCYLKNSDTWMHSCKKGPFIKVLRVSSVHPTSLTSLRMFLRLFDLKVGSVACLRRFANMQVKGSSMQLKVTYQQMLNLEAGLSDVPKLSPALHVCAVQYVTASKKGPHKQSSLVLGSQRAFTAASFQQLVYGAVSQ